MRELTVAIAGGGIGGLAAALCLAKKGCLVQVFEQAKEFAEAGAGIQLSPNCTRVLHHLGLEGALRKRAFLPEATQFRHWRRGFVISENTLGEDASKRYGAPYYHMHRGDLLAVLLDAAQAAPEISLTLDAPVETLEQSADGVTLHVNGTSQTADVLVGADGIHSKVRGALWGSEQARFTGNVAWRTLVPADRLPPGLIRPMSTAWWGPGKHFVHYYVRGGELVNCVCVVEKTGWEVESWTAPGDLRELKQDFSGWHSTVTQLLDHADDDSLYKWALFDRDPMPSWGKGRVTLLGDACHPTLPFMAQGAAMAIEDAAVLANCLAASAQGSAAYSIENRLAAYERARRKRTAGIQMGSRRNARVFHLSGPKAWLRNRAVRSVGSRTVESLYSYNPLKEGL